MDNNKKCSVCNMKLDVVNNLKHRIVCKSCYHKNRSKNNSNIPRLNQKWKLLITITIEPQSSSDEVLELLGVMKTRIPRSTST